MTILIFLLDLGYGTFLRNTSIDCICYVANRNNENQ